MKNKTTKLLLFFFLLAITTVSAQDQANSIDPPKSKKNSISLYAGLPGFGLGYGRQLNNHFSLRFKGSIFNFSILRENLDLSNRKVDIVAAFKYNTLDLLLDYLPFKNSSFKLVAGLSYLATAKADILIKPAGDLTLGKVVIPKEQIGEIKSGTNWSGLAPYLAMGFGRAIPKEDFGVGFEVGGYFVGKPDFAFDASKMLTPTTEIEKENHEFQSWMDKFVFIPSIMFHFNYKL